jgi:hypothetical protein
MILGLRRTATIPPVAGASKLTTMTLAGPSTLALKMGELPPLKKSQAAHKKSTP